jgi:hypothetical protein
MDKRRSSSSTHDIEMTTFSETSIKRSRSGSFTGRIVDSPGGRRSGYSDFAYSARTGVFDVKTIVSDAHGGGKRMLSQMEGIARQHGATSMETATSRPGFFKKSGFDYTPGQHLINQRKYTASELQEQENNREERGGGFVLHKPLV